MPRMPSAATRWRTVIDDFQQSGLKHAEFCRRRGLSLHTFRKYLYGSRPIAPARRERRFCRSRHRPRRSTSTGTTRRPTRSS